MIKSFLMGRKDHPTADVIYSNLKQQDPNLSLGTVYRNLTLLSDSIDSIMETAGERFDGRIRGHITYFYGTCPACTRVATKS